MASPIGVSALVADDALKFALPTFLGLGLLVPFAYPKVDASHLVLVSVFVGIIATPLIGNIYLRIVYCLTDLGDKAKLEMARGARRWDYDQMIYQLSRDERNGITLSDARATFTLMLSAYFLAFGIAIVLFVPFQVAPRGNTPYGAFLRDVLTVPVPMLTGMRVPAIVGFLVSIVIWRLALKQYFRQQELLFGTHYPQLARKVQLEIGGIARAIWGEVTLSPRGELSDADWQKVGRRLRSLRSSGTVRLCTLSDDEIGSSRIDCDGGFTFELDPGRFSGSLLQVIVEHDGIRAEQLVQVVRRSVPRFEFEIAAEKLLGGTSVSCEC